MSLLRSIIVVLFVLLILSNRGINKLHAEVQELKDNLEKVFNTTHQKINDIIDQVDELNDEIETINKHHKK